MMSQSCGSSAKYKIMSIQVKSIDVHIKHQNGGEKSDLMVVWVRWAGLSVSGTAYLLGFSHTAVLRSHRMVWGGGTCAACAETPRWWGRSEEEDGQTGLSWQEDYEHLRTHSTLNLEMNWPQQQLTTSGSTPVSHQQESEASVKLNRKRTDVFQSITIQCWWTCGCLLTCWCLELYEWVILISTYQWGVRFVHCVHWSWSDEHVLYVCVIFVAEVPGDLTVHTRWQQRVV